MRNPYTDRYLISIFCHKICSPNLKQAQSGPTKPELKVNLNCSFFQWLGLRTKVCERVFKLCCEDEIVGEEK